MMTFSLKWILLAVAIVGIGCVALNNASPFWEVTTLNLAIASFIFAVLAGIARRGVDRVFWVGFAVVGWLYLAISIGPWFATTIEPKLATTRMLDYAYPIISRELTWDEIGIEPTKTASLPDIKVGGKTIKQVSNTVRWPFSRHFESVGHSLWSLVLALIAGATARLLHRGEE